MRRDRDYPRLTEMLRRESAFSYTCHACNRCCYDKRIHVNPYEVARIARNRGLSTTDILDRYTEDGGSALAVRSDGACVFLGERGCSIHADRPLACRLYPLGRVVMRDGEEYFVPLKPHPQSAGSYGIEGTVGDYLASQNVDAYIDAAKKLRAVLTEWMSVVTADGEAVTGASESTASAQFALLDFDSTVAAACAREGIPEPADLEERLEVYLGALREYGSHACHAFDEDHSD